MNRTCHDCPAPAEHGYRGRCKQCYYRARSRLTVGECARCARQRPVWPEDGLCGRCAQVVGRDWPPWVRACCVCGCIRQICAYDMCRLCYEKQPERPLAYAAGLEQRLVEVPGWFGAFVEYVVERLSPSRARDVLRELGRLINTTGSTSPAALLQDSPPRLRRMLVPFLSSRGLVLPGEDDSTVRYRQRKQRRVAEVPEPFRPAVAEYAATLERRRQRARRLGLRADSDATAEDHLRTIRNLAAFCLTHRVDRWETVTRGDVEAFLARRDTPSAHELGDLRSFFRWARRQRLILASPVDGLRILQPGSFRGETLDTDTQRTLYRRWTTADGVHPHEAFFGLVGLIHGATTSEIRHLLVGDIDPSDHTVRLGKRRQPVPLDPATWDALQRCVDHRASQRGANPHLIVTGRSASTDLPAGATYFTSLMRPAGIPPQSLRTTRMSALANRADPVIIAAALGVTFKTAAYYRNEGVDDTRHGQLVEHLSH